MKRLYNEDANYSERFTYIQVPVKPGEGANPQDTYECIRTKGLIDDALMPMTNSLAEFLDTSDLTGSLLAKGQNWLYNHTFQHEWLWTFRPNNWKQILKDALVSSPLGVSVSAWKQVDGLYVSTGRNNHWCLLYKIDQDGVMYVFDTYDHSRKRLHPDHDISRAKRIWVNKLTNPAMRQHVGILQAIVKRLMNQRSFLDIVNAKLGTDVTPHDEYPDEVSCAWSLSTLENEFDPTFKKIPGTWNLWDYYEHHPKFVRVSAPKPGTRIICATLQGKPFPGHCGVFMEDMTIASNDSRSGKFMKNYDYERWVERYQKQGGYEIHMYDHV
jgi:hypothetical protein